ncbi:MAG: nucleotidyltransferase family protein [Candidatus Aenigmatarchaeota archaeon]
MKALVLAGGHAKRMGKIAENTPKPLLKVANKTLLERTLRKLEHLDLEKVYVSTNSKFGPIMEQWLSGFEYSKDIQLIVEPVATEEEKLGSIGALKYFMNQESVDGNFLVVGGDNIFQDNLQEIFMFYKEKQTPIVGLSNVSMVEARKMGTVQLDDNKKIIDFVEKAENPKSTLASAAVYFFPENTKKLIEEYLSEGNHKDTMGFFIDWLRQKTPTYGFILDGKWIDIGTPDAYELAQKEFV